MVIFFSLTYDDQKKLSNIMPKDRRWSYPVRDIIKIISDIEQFTEIRPDYGKGIVSCFIRIEGKPFGLLANDSQHLGGAIDSEGADKATSFIEIRHSSGVLQHRPYSQHRPAHFGPHQNRMHTYHPCEDPHL